MDTQFLPQTYSVGIHASAIILLFTWASTHPVVPQIKDVIALTDPPPLAPLMARSRNGGGGGGRMPLPAGKGVHPPRAERQFVPPAAVLTNPHPKLAMEPTIIAPPDATPQTGPIGDPLGKLGLASNGPGIGGGIGSGKDGGVGNNRGPGAGPGECCGGGVFTPGMDGVTAPVVIFQVEPQYSEEARKAKFSGVVMLELIVDASGRARDIRVRSGAGMGLDEKAMEAVRQWRFKPGMRAGQAVAVHARVEVNFRLL